MRLDINLASRPYQDMRRFVMRWGGIVALMTILTAVLVFFAFRSWRESRDVNAQINTVQSEIRALDKERQEGIALLNQASNRTTAEQSKFLNQLIVKKAFSWTSVFMDLERIMPPGLHVVSIKPELSPDNQLRLTMVVGGTSRDRAVELVRRMEQSPTFRQAVVNSEAARENTSEGDTIRFEISAIYVPQLAAANNENAAPTKNESATPAPNGAGRNPGGQH
jgi:type IV pilus assembly protein PilN